MQRPLRAALCPARRETPQSAAHRNGCNGRNGTACSSALEPAHMTARHSPPQEAGWLLGWAARGAGPGRAGRAVPRCTERCGGRRLSVPLALPAQVRRAGSAAVPRGGGGGTCHAREPYGSCGVPGGFGGGRAATAPRRERGGNEAGAAAGEGAAEAGEGLPGCPARGERHLPGRAAVPRPSRAALLQRAGGPGAGLLIAATGIFYVLLPVERAVSTAQRRFVVRLIWLSFVREEGFALAASLVLKTRWAKLKSVHVFLSEYRSGAFTAKTEVSSQADSPGTLWMDFVWKVI